MNHNIHIKSEFVFKEFNLKGKKKVIANVPSVEKDFNDTKSDWVFYYCFFKNGKFTKKFAEWWAEEMTVWCGFASWLKLLHLICVSLNSPFSDSSYRFKEENPSPLEQMTRKSSSNLQKREKGMGKCINLTEECLSGIQTQTNIWTGMVSSCVWWKVSPFQAANFGSLTCWLYHLGITGLSDAFQRASPHACAHSYPVGRWQAKACEWHSGASRSPALPCPDIFLAPPSSTLQPVFESLSIKCHFRCLYY